MQKLPSSANVSMLSNVSNGWRSKRSVETYINIFPSATLHVRQLLHRHDLASGDCVALLALCKIQAPAMKTHSNQHGSLRQSQPFHPPESSHPEWARARGSGCLGRQWRRASCCVIVSRTTHRPNDKGCLLGHRQHSVNLGDAEPVENLSHSQLSPCSLFAVT